MADDAPILVLITAATREEAARLADMLVGARLAACVQLLPEIESIYRWKGKIEREQETLLLVKTSQVRFADLEREVRAIHSYETPEIVALPIIAGSSDYLSWLQSNVGAE